MRLDVWADVTCPWCYLGTRRLEKALAAHRAEGGPEVEVVWRPYQLHPDLPATAEPLGEHTHPDEHHSAEQVSGYLAEVAEGAGPGFRWGPRWRPNTFHAHLLLGLARERGGPALQWRLAERLFAAHFSEGADLSDRDLLVRLAAEVGLAEAAEAFGDDARADRLRAELSEGVAIGIRLVPTFVVGRRAVGGAQPADVLLDLLRSGTGPTADTAASVFVSDDPVENLRRGEALLEARDPLGALRLLEPLCEQFPDDHGLQVTRARAYLGSAQLRRAQDVLERLVERHPTDDYAVFLLGRALERQSRHAAARDRFRVAAAMSPRPDYLDALERTTARAGHAG